MTRVEKDILNLFGDALTTQSQALIEVLIVIEEAIKASHDAGELVRLKLRHKQIMSMIRDNNRCVDSLACEPKVHLSVPVNR